MSGHSRWASIKHKKGAIDAQRGKLFSKLVKEITVAAKMGGESIETNPRLRLAVAKAKENSMPAKNIDNAIKRGAGTMEGVNYEEITYEGYGPGGVGILVTCLTDNKNRSVSEVRSTFTKNGGNLAEAGAVSWQFEKKGILSVERSVEPDEEKFMEIALECGAEDVETSDEGYVLKTDVASYVGVLDALKQKNIKVAESELGFWPKNAVPVDAATAEKIQHLVSVLDDLDDTQTVASNEQAE